jgi:penicillin-binding protein 1C
MKFIKWAVLLLLVAYIATTLIPAPKLQTNSNSSRALLDRSGKLLSFSLSDDDKYRVFFKLGEISKDFAKATLLYEDKYFYWHFGFNPYSLIRAGFESISNQERLVGGSTITMQLARINYKIYTRNISGKLKQILYAIWYELKYSKNEILEAYLNLAPYGSNIEGVGAASLIYYKKLPKDLNVSEAITLAVIPQNPALRWKKEGISNLEIARAKLVSKWKDEENEDIIPRDLVFSPNNLENRTPHLLNRLKKDFNSHYTSTIDYDIQDLTQKELNLILKRYKDLGIYNASVIIVELPDMKVRAYVGSAQYTNNSINGFVNGLKAKRSPGSLLKPFIYGLAIDQGIITPSTMLLDVPIRLASYRPENFERNFLGPISATDALIRSRNIPALELFRQLEKGSFYKLLVDANVTKLKNEDFYGIALVLGGLGVSAEEIATLYGILGNIGEYKSLKFSDNYKQITKKNLFSAEASNLVLEMLAKNPPALRRQRSVDIAWKTGTSYGAKDAWSAGIIGKYVVVVWLGNFNGKANPNLVGRDIAGPLLFSVADRLLQYGSNISNNNYKLLNIKNVEVCAVSGALPTDNCIHRKSSTFIPGVSPISHCTLHKKVRINPKSGLRLCNNQVARSQDSIEKIYEFWDTTTQSVFEKAGLKRNSPPSFEKECLLNSDFDEKNIRIISPEDNIEYIVIGNNYSEIELLAETTSAAKKISWFANNKFITQTQANKSYLWKAKSGEYIIRAVDDRGEAKTVNIKIVQEVG